MTNSGWALQRVLEPQVEPLTLDQAKKHCRVDIDEDDEYITDLVREARSYIEEYTSRALIEQRWELTLDCFPRIITLWRPPIIRVLSVGYVDTNGDTQTLEEGTHYVVDTKREPGRIIPAYGQCWPSTRPQINAVTVTYEAGYESNGSPANAENVPGPIIRALKLLLAHWYENREEVVVGQAPDTIPMGVHAALAPFRIHSF